MAEVHAGQHQEDALHHTFCSSTEVGGRNGVTVGHGEAGRSSCKLRQLGDAEEGPNGEIEVGKSSTSCSPAMLFSGAGVMLGTLSGKMPWRAAPVADAEERPWPRRTASQCKMTARRAGIAAGKGEMRTASHGSLQNGRLHALRTIRAHVTNKGQYVARRTPHVRWRPTRGRPRWWRQRASPSRATSALDARHTHTADTHHRSHAVSMTNP